MFDIGFTELLVIGVVALIVVGPKDLPGMFRTLGRFTARARQMGREFSQAMNDAADQSGAKDIADTFKSATSPKAMGLDALNKAADGFEKWDPAKALQDTKDADAAVKAQEAKVNKPEMDDARAEAARKIHEATAKSALKQQDEEAKAAAEAKEAATAQKKAKAKDAADKALAPKKARAKKPAAKKPAAKKPAAKKPAAKKTTSKTASKASAKSKPKPTDTSDA